MAVTALGSGTQAAVISTEHTLYTWANADAGKFGQLVVDTNALVNGETVELRLYYVALSGGTERLAYSASFSHQQADPIKFSPPIAQELGLSSVRATLKQVAGTGRSFPWKMLGW